MPLWPLATLPVRPTPKRASSATATWQSTTVTPSGTPHTMGSWAEVLASTTYDAQVLALRGNGASTAGTGRPTLLDLGVGANPDEAAWLTGLDIGYHAAGTTWLIPCNIPAGSRLVARAQGAVATTISISVDLYGAGSMLGGLPPVSKWTTYGSTASTSTGTAVTPGDAAWGSWTQISTTTADHDVWLFTMGMGTDSGLNSRSYRAQVAFAPDATAAGTCATNGTHIEAANWSTSTAELIDRFDRGTWTHYAKVPSGAGIWCRMSCSATPVTAYLTAHGGSI